MEKGHNDLRILLHETLAPVVRLGWSLFPRVGRDSRPCRLLPGFSLLLLLLFSFRLLCPDLLSDALV